MIAPRSAQVLDQLRKAGLVLPRPPYPGQEWKPRTDAEQHLLGECRRLDRVRQLLLADVGRLRQEVAKTPRRELIAADARTADRLRDCPLTQAQIDIVAAAAAGESVEETARRLFLSCDAVKSHRQRAVLRLHARNLAHAVALCTAAGWITAGQITGGVAP
jgi:DNA-binding CsgD family transcriptional regulator